MKVYQIRLQEYIRHKNHYANTHLDLIVDDKIVYRSYDEALARVNQIIEKKIKKNGYRKYCMPLSIDKMSNIQQIGFATEYDWKIRRYSIHCITIK
ncbi:MAG: hypothetical protein MJ237_05960 [bacterium]|nr:hypothetical protein [bacterium]